MDLWIKVQNNKKLKQGLVKVNDLFVEKDSEDGKWRITQCCDTLGIYKTEKRALEVLDEIQDLLEQEEMLHINKSLLNDLDDIEEPKYILRPVYQPRVYKMPKE